MAGRRGRSTSPQPRHSRTQSRDEDGSIIGSRQLEALSRTVHATASQLISSNFASSNDHGSSSSPAPDPYRTALSTVHRSLRRPMIQRSVFSFAKANPRELIRSNFNTAEIEQRAITFIPDELLKNVGKSSSPYSLFEGFQASVPEDDGEETLAEKVGRRRRKHGSKGQKLLAGAVAEEEEGPPALAKLRGTKGRLDRKLEMMGIRKTMCASEIKEIDAKIQGLSDMRRVVLERLKGLEEEEYELETEVQELGVKVEEMAEELEELAVREKEAAAVKAVPVMAEEPVEESEPEVGAEEDDEVSAMDESFMSESIYGKLPKANSKASPAKRRKLPRRISMPVLHEHMEPGTRIRELQAHNDTITALDFDVPFGMMVTAALDDTVRVWDLSAGRCMGLLEGHLSSVRCLQVEDHLVATGSMDASIRLWDLSQADYTPPPPSTPSKPSISDTSPEPSSPVTADDLFKPTSEQSPTPSSPTPATSTNATENCHLFTLSSHVAEITALNFRGNTLVSGSADKTLRQWDLETGRCVQTLDVLWAAAQASTINPSVNATPSTASTSSGKDAAGWFRPTTGRLNTAEADFVGALQVFESALACGTADGMVRLWDLRSGMIWDLRTGGIHDAYAYDNPVTGMMFDQRHIVSAAGESVVKVYDKADGRHWDCGESVESEGRKAVVERVRIKDGFMVEGRRDGVVGVWSC
ncbi:hypothetical protein B0A48_04855 [Cryoendolithus antarcticus]|uniref:Mitochondrial division protein 1 n=1 Tax=Cryoendolithus antarcticus TaxID=1507870 RepID=A0A1V8TDJ7_9PEZI|nr:hypothetical protein B0A48_04855 [Cryoendolithus antarcticus]